MWFFKRPKAIPSRRNIKNFKYWSHNEMFWFKKTKCYDEYEAKWKASKLCYQVLWEVIYAYFYNWDWSLFLVLIVYVLVELIIESSHYTKDYLILISTHFTQVYVQWMSYSFVWLYLIKYVFACSIFVNQAQKYFWVF